MNPGFSIVVCTYNGASRLVPTLKHIARLKIPEGCSCELILVDNASTDNTQELTRKIWQQEGTPFSLNIIKEARAGKGYAVETGYDAAHFEYVVTADDDNWLNENYLVNALPILQQDPSIGALLGKSTGVFEKDPPEWFSQDWVAHFFVIGGPIAQPGYFPKDNFGTWGAGTIIRKADWNYLRSEGFTFLTSKLPGKAAGEDHELGRALLMIGKTFYYSDQLTFSHYMPADRVTWEKLKNNFETFGYVSHYNLLFALTFDALEKGYALTQAKIDKAFYAYARECIMRFTPKQHLAYWLRPQHEYYQLKMLQHYAHFKWFSRLKKNALKDVEVLKGWMTPIMQKYPNKFRWAGKAY